MSMKFYDFSARKVNGKEVKMEEYKGKVLLVVNTSSKCGLTHQLKRLESLYKEYKVNKIQNRTLFIKDKYEVILK